MSTYVEKKVKKDDIQYWMSAFDATVRSFESLEQPTVQYVIDRYKPRRVLDIGTGNGMFLLSFARKYPEIKFSAIDQNEYLLDIFDKSLTPKDRDHIDLEQHTFTEKGYGTHYDLAICRFTMGHLADPISFLKGVHNSLKSDGIYISFDGAVSMSQGLARGFWKDYMTVFNKVFSTWGSDGNYPLKAVPNLQQAGFELEDQITRMMYLNSQTEEKFLDYMKHTLALFHSQSPRIATEKKIEKILTNFHRYKEFEVPPYITLTQTIARKS